MGNIVAKRLAELENKGISLEAKDGKIAFKAAKGSLSDEDKAFLKNNKPEVLKYLEKDGLTMQELLKDTEVSPDEKFPLTDIQAAYILGRNNIKYGSVSCQILLEFEYEEMDPVRCEQIWRQLIARHEMLRASFTLDGYQVIADKKEFKVDFYDLSSLDDEALSAELTALRDKAARVQFDLIDGYPFEVSVVKLKNCSYMQLTIEFIVADWTSVMMLLNEFETRYFEPDKAEEKPVELTFHKYMSAYEKYTDSIAYEKDRLYWLEKVKSLPPAPAIDILSDSASAEPRFKRFRYDMDIERYLRFKETAQKYKVTPTVALITAYSSVLGKWSDDHAFSLNLTLLNRMNADEKINAIIGDFTTTDLLAVDMREKKKFSEYCLAIGSELFENIDHRLFSGVNVVREYAKSKNSDMALFPYVFTSSIGQIHSSLKGKMTDGCISSTPQVFIDCQAMDGDFGLSVNWDVRQGIFREGTVEKMFAVFAKLVDRLADNASFWESAEIVSLPDEDRTIIDAANKTAAHLPEHLIHSEIIERIKDSSERIAVRQGDVTVTYKELGEYSAGVAEKLSGLGAAVNEKTGIILPKSYWQVYAVIGILCAGGVYVPIDASGVVERRDEIITNCGIRKVITLSSYSEPLPADVTRINIDETEKGSLSSLKCVNKLSDEAYIIHTSGSTGKPKGVVITHEGAVNTIEDINGRFDVTKDDAALALSNLWFDLSVYDIFGLLSVGGKIVYPETERYIDPSHWAELVENENITVWNSVPAFMKMYYNYISSKELKGRKFPRLVMLSGDWIDIDLFDDLKPYASDTRFISLGGATEASIWSIFYEYKNREAWWQSIPYGKPLANQGFMILDEKMDECPIGVKGELYISGKGLAKEYFNAPEITEKSFVTYKNGERIYKTGDYGRYFSDGNIEFLGRMDNQVKVHGYRIELGEIENALRNLDYVKECVVVAVEGRAKDKTICSLVVGNEDGLTEERVLNDVSRLIPKYMYPKKIFFTETLPLSVNGKIDRKQSAKTVTELLSSIKENDRMAEKTGSDDEVLKKVSAVWEKVLDVADIDADEDLYDIGADSVVMITAATELSKAFGDKVPFDGILTQMLNYSTVRAAADYIKELLNDAKCVVPV